MFEEDNTKLSADYNLVWTNMKDTVIQAFVNLYGENYRYSIENIINQIRFVHVSREDKTVLEDKFLDLYEKIRLTLLNYHAISPDASVKDVLEFSKKYVNGQLISYYIDNDVRAFDQLTSKIIECAYYYSAVRKRDGVSYGNPDGKYIIEFNDYYIPLEELFSKINQMFCNVNTNDTLMGIFNNLFARELTTSFLSITDNVEGLVKLGSSQRYTNIYKALYNDNKSIVENMYTYYRDYLKELFITNKYSDFIFFFEESSYNSLNNYLNGVVDKISYALYTNPNADISNVLTEEERNYGVNLLNTIYSKLSLRKLKKMTN